MRRLLCSCLAMFVSGLQAAEQSTSAIYPDGWMGSEYHRLDAQLSAQSSFGFTINPEHYVSEVRVAFALSDGDAYRSRHQPFMLQLTLRGWKLMETDLDTRDTDYFERERVRDRDIRKQWVMLSVVKSF